jgi:hypothetical protein
MKPQCCSRRSGSLRLCIDYLYLNKVTLKNKYLILRVEDPFDPLGDASFFTKLDLRPGYYQVRIAEGNEPKRSILYEWESSHQARCG